MADTATIAKVAGDAFDWFEMAKRDDDSQYVTLKDGRPDWLYELVREAHGDMLPDDWRYQTIRSAFGWIYDNKPEDLDDAAHDFADDNVDTYNTDRIAWLGSHAIRPNYCDTAADEGLIGNDVDVIRIIGAGQYVESLEVWAIVARGLVARVEEMAGE